MTACACPAFEEASMMLVCSCNLDKSLDRRTPWGPARPSVVSAYGCASAHLHSLCNPPTKHAFGCMPDFEARMCVVSRKTHPCRSQIMNPLTSLLVLISNEDASLDVLVALTE